MWNHAWHHSLLQSQFITSDTRCPNWTVNLVIAGSQFNVSTGLLHVCVLIGPIWVNNHTSPLRVVILVLCTGTMMHKFTAVLPWNQFSYHTINIMTLFSTGLFLSMLPTYNYGDFLRDYYILRLKCFPGYHIVTATTQQQQHVIFDLSRASEEISTFVSNAQNKAYLHVTMCFWSYGNF